MITVSSPIIETPRVAQLRGLFDLPPSITALESWDPPDILSALATRPWNIGLIYGPSGCGKSTIANHLFPIAARPALPPVNPATIIDLFSPDLPIRTVTDLLSSVGFSSPPSWLKPFHVLSTGQQFRALMALTLASGRPRTPILIDEYTSVIDRTVARIGSAAIAKTIRRMDLQTIMVTCHDDVLAWLQPDWTYTPCENKFSWRLLHPRPPIHIDIVRTTIHAWPLFAPHHYLTAAIHPAARCFLASLDQTPVAFSSWLHHFAPGPPAKREHRTVCLPDFQGVGIGNALSATIASMWTSLGFSAFSTTTHPSMIASRRRSPLWTMHRAPSLGKLADSIPHDCTRLTAGFSYTGPKMSHLVAKTLLAL